MTRSNKKTFKNLIWQGYKNNIFICRIFVTYMKDISLSFIETHKLILLIQNIQMYKWTNETYARIKNKWHVKF